NCLRTDLKRNPNRLLLLTRKEKIKRSDRVKGSIVKANLEKQVRLRQVLETDKQGPALQDRDKQPEDQVLPDPDRGPQGLDKVPGKAMQIGVLVPDPQREAVGALQVADQTRDLGSKRQSLPKRRSRIKINKLSPGFRAAGNPVVEEAKTAGTSVLKGVRSWPKGWMRSRY